MSYLKNFFVSIDQLGNAIAGGNPDNTISSRVGFYNHFKYNPNTVPIQWKVLEKIINTTFWPIDGEDHCKEAFRNDAGESFNNQPNNIVLSLLATIIIIPSCLLIAALLYLLLLVRLVSPKDITPEKRKKGILNRLHLSESKLKGILNELNDEKVEIDDSLVKASEKVLIQAQELNGKIRGMDDLLDRLD